MICARTTVTIEQSPVAVSLLVNGKSGNVKVTLDTDVEIKVVGLDPGSNIDIKNISETPDQTILTGLANSNGVYVAILQFNEDKTITLQGYYGFAALGTTNQVNVTAGKGSQDWSKLILPAALILGGAYLVSTFMKPGDSG